MLIERLPSWSRARRRKRVGRVRSWTCVRAEQSLLIAQIYDGAPSVQDRVGTSAITKEKRRVVLITIIMYRDRTLVINTHV